MIILAVSYINEDWWNEQGLIMNIFMILRSNALIPIVIGFIDIEQFIRWVKRRSLKNQGIDCILTQEQANM